MIIYPISHKESIAARLGTALLSVLALAGILLLSTLAVAG